MKRVNLTEDQIKLIKDEQTRILTEQFSGHFDRVIDEAISEVMTEQGIDPDEEISDQDVDTQMNEIQPDNEEEDIDLEEGEEDLEEESSEDTGNGTPPNIREIINLVKGEHRDEFRGKIERSIEKKVKGQTINFTFVGDFDKDYQEIQSTIQDDLSREKYRLLSRNVIVLSYINKTTKETDQIWFMPVTI